MSKKVRKRVKRATPRDPFWRLRRLLGARRKESAKAYRRADTRKAERQAAPDGDG
jgi:hypothetical protein